MRGAGLIVHYWSLTAAAPAPLTVSHLLILLHWVIVTKKYNSRSCVCRESSNRMGNLEWNKWRACLATFLICNHISILYRIRYRRARTGWRACRRSDAYARTLNPDSAIYYPKRARSFGLWSVYISRLCRVYYLLRHRWSARLPRGSRYT